MSDDSRYNAQWEINIFSQSHEFTGEMLTLLKNNKNYGIIDYKFDTNFNCQFFDV
jgi:hypothetical protein